MPVFVEFGTADQGQPVENGTADASESVASAGLSAAAPTDGFVTVTADENGYVAIGAGTPSAASNPRRRVLSGIPRSFAIERGQKVAFTAG
jgi:hypothetical protein